MVYDTQERLILKALVKDPRMSDNKIGKLTRVPIRTVSRKRKKMEQNGMISYYVSVKHNGNPKVRHLYLIKFKMGYTRQRLMEETKKEPKVKTIFTEFIYKSNYAEIDGHTAILMVVEGQTDNEISENFNGKILPAMLINHGDGCIEDISTIRLSETIRVFHNYLPFINMKNGKIDPKWMLESIYIE
ncbi:MAG: Lrp/AsnC family transcriptional regulator [Nanoarchaeota archaeon]